MTPAEVLARLAEIESGINVDDDVAAVMWLIAQLRKSLEAEAGLVEVIKNLSMQSQCSWCNKNADVLVAAITEHAKLREPSGEPSGGGG